MRRPASLTPIVDLIRGFVRTTKRLSSTFVVALGFVALVLGATVVGARIAGVDVTRLMRDPLVVAGAPALTGFVSNLGVLLWSAAAGACFVAALGLRRRAGGRVRAEFFAAAGGLTTILVLDDLYQLHEEVIPGLFGRGETLAMLAYVLLTMAFVLRYRRTLLAGEYPLLVVAGGAFAVSIGIDYVGLIGIDPESLGSAGQVVEDGAKLTGIALWLAYFVRAAAALIADPVTVPAPAPTSEDESQGIDARAHGPAA